MRLIDADVLKQHIDKLPALPDGNFAGNHSALKALINMQPTIEPSTNCSEFPNNSDTVSRQAVLDAIVQCTNCGDEDTLREYVLKHSLDNGWTGGILEALDAVKDLPPAQPEPQWIPVSERLPEKKGESFFDGMVLTTLRDTETGELYVLNDNYCGDGNWLMCLPDDPTEVIAWMPLPEPYKPNNE